MCRENELKGRIQNYVAGGRTEKVGRRVSAILEVDLGCSGSCSKVHEEPGNLLQIDLPLLTTVVL